MSLLFSCVGNIGGSDSSSTTSSTATEVNSSEETTVAVESVESEESTKSEVVEKTESVMEDENDTIGVFESEEPEKDPAHAYIGDVFMYQSGSTLELVSAGVRRFAKLLDG